MNLDMVWEVGTLVLALALVGFAAAAEIALTMCNRGRLQEELQKGSRSAQRVRELLAAPERFLSTLLVVRTTGVIAASGASVLLARRVRQGILSLVVGLLLLLVLVLVIRVTLRALVIRAPYGWALRVSMPVGGLVTLISPLTALLSALGERVWGRAVDEFREESVFLTEDGLRYLIHVGDEEGAIEPDEKEMIASIVEFGDTLAREVMVPRIDVVALPVTTPIPEALEVIMREGYSRIPVYEETIDNIIGILYAKDLLGCFREGHGERPIRDFLREAYFIPESMKVDDLLRELRRRRVHMAVAVDEYGGTAGLVTIEDLLEEIVGEIQDEYDSEEPLVEQIGEGDYRFHGRISLDDASELLGINLPREAGDTLGGFIYSQLGRVPTTGDKVTFDRVVMTVLEIEGRSVKRVHAVREQDDDATSVAQSESSGGGTLSLFLLR